MKRVRGVLLLWPWLALACQPGPGSSCEEGEARCLDPRRELVCDNGKFVETPCRGKAGCTTLKEGTSCDISGNHPGDPCSGSEEGAAACTSADAMLACHSGKFERLACRGPKGCETAAGQPHCDQSIAAVGDGCRLPNAKACAADARAVLVCRASSMQALYACRGEAGCRSAAGKLSCDQSIARANDACDKALEGHVACNEDKGALLTCQKEAFAASETCKRGALCTVVGQSTRCAKP